MPESIKFADGTRQTTAQPSPFWSTQFLRENVDRSQCSSLVSGGAIAGTMGAMSIPLFDGDLISSICMRTGSTALNTPTNWWFALYDIDLNLLSQSADQGSTALAAATTVDLSLQTAQRISRNGIYYAVYMFAAAAVASWIGVNTTNAIGANGIVAGQRRKHFRSSAGGLTTTAPSAFGAAVNATSIPYVICH